MSRKMTKQDCAGCYNNFYNGNNPYGVQECWSFKTATLEQRIDVPVDLRPPYTHLKPRLRPTCYKGKGYVHIKPEALTKDGYWK